MELRGVVRFNGSDGGEGAADDFEPESNEPIACAERAGPFSTAAITRHMNKGVTLPIENMGSLAQTEEFLTQFQNAHARRVHKL